MRFPLDCEENVEQSLLFWLSRFVKYKLNSLSNKELKDPPALSRIIIALTKGVQNIQELDILVKQARNAGLTGINTYFNPLKKIFELLNCYNLYSLKQIDEELLSDCLASSTGGLSDATKKNYRIAVISFFKFLDEQNTENTENDNGEIIGNVTHRYNIKLENWKGIKGSGGEKLPEFLHKDELNRFLSAIDEANFKSNTDRNKLIIKLIVYTGIRVSEAINVKQKDITKQDDFFIIRIRAKGNKYRVVMIKQHLISDLLSSVVSSSFNKDGLVFCNKKGGKLTQAYVSRIVEQILFQAGIRKQKNGAHMLRHTFATLLYKEKKDIILVQEALGHASLNTSRIYTHFDNQRLKEAAQVAENLSKNQTLRA